MVDVRTILLLVTTTLLGSCAGAGIESGLAESRELWDAAGLAAYEYELTLDCFCPPAVTGPFHVSVVAGRSVEVARIDSDDDSVALEEVLDGTIEAMFQFVESNADADLIEVKYDEVLGYPITVIVDPSEEVLDDEISIEVVDFVQVGN